MVVVVVVVVVVPGDGIPGLVEAESALHSLGNNFRQIEIKSWNKSLGNLEHHTNLYSLDKC